MRKILTTLCLLFVVGMLSVNITAMFLQQPYSMPTTSSIPFYIQYARVDGGLYQVAPIISNAAVDVTLTSGQSGSTVNVTAGSAVGTDGIATITLPVPTAGMVYDVNWLTSITAGTMEVRTDAATTFISGGITVNSANGTGAMAANCNGTTHVAVQTNGTTKGGVIGTWLRFKALSSTLWNVSGIATGSGTADTPCST